MYRHFIRSIKIDLMKIIAQMTRYIIKVLNSWSNTYRKRYSIDFRKWSENSDTIRRRLASIKKRLFSF